MRTEVPSRSSMAAGGTQCGHIPTLRPHSETIFPDDSDIEFHLAFKADGRELMGQGIVRWAAELEQIVGIEIERVQESGRAWLLQRTRENPTLSFIPRSPNPDLQVK